MKKLLKLPILLVLLVAGSLLSSCVATTGAVVTAGPARPYYGPAYYDPYHRPYGRPYYRPSRVIVRPAPVVRPRTVIVSPHPYHARPYRGGGWRR